MLKIENLKSGYGKVVVLRGISFNVAEGETVAIIGPNGAGKTTTLKTISGLVRSSGGSVILDGKDVAGLSADKITRMGISYVPEGGRPFPNMSVYDNLRMGAYACKEVLKTGILEEIYEIFPRLKERLPQMARTLSGGERVMLGIARGLMSRPKIIMLDEPSLGLAPKLVDEIYEKIRKLRSEMGLTVLLVEQNTSYALELASRAYVLENGEFVMEGDCVDLVNSEHVKKAYMGL